MVRELCLCSLLSQGTKGEVRKNSSQFEEFSTIIDGTITFFFATFTVEKAKVMVPSMMVEDKIVG
jgi:hypothetical protein